ncbi:MAG: hypothetical protein FJX75_21940 [Armatimonadetes bacterium]|nr:hypothetical protein [Armatimonadota bacterium]
MTDDKDRDLGTDESPEDEPEETPEEKPRRKGKRDAAPVERKSRRELRAERQAEARQRIHDPRAIAALGEERPLLEQLGIPAFFAGLGTLLVGIGWAIILQALKRPGPIVCLTLGVILLAYGVLFGLRTVARQMHGRGFLVVLVAIALTFAVLLMLVGVNALFLTRTVRIDKTQSRYLSLSAQSRDVVRKITQDVNIYVVIQRNALQFTSYNLDQVRRLLHEYEVVSDHIKWEIVDIYRDPERAQELGVTFPGKALLKSGDKREEVTLSNDNEQNLTSAILRVTKPEKEAVYYLTGHGELKLEEFGSDRMGCSALRKALTNVQLDVKELALKQSNEGAKPPINVEVKGLEKDTGKAALENIPPEAKAVMVLGPKTPLAKSEMDALSRYLDQKQGGLFIALAYEPGAPDFHEILGKYNVTVEPGIAVDPYKRTDRMGTPLIETPQGHDVLNNITVLETPACRVFQIPETPPQENPYGGPPPKQDAISLLKTSGEGLVAQVKPAPQGKGLTIAVDPNSPRSERTLAVLIDTKKEKPPTPPGMPEMPEPEEPGPGNRIVVVGSYLMLTDQLQPQLPVAGVNTDFVAQAVSWLAGGQAISIPERKPPTVTIGFKPITRKLVGLVLVGFIPLGTIVIGVVVWWRRR